MDSWHQRSVNLAPGPMHGRITRDVGNGAYEVLLEVSTQAWPGLKNAKTCRRFFVKHAIDRRRDRKVGDFCRSGPGVDLGLRPIARFDRNNHCVAGNVAMMPCAFLLPPWEAVKTKDIKRRQGM